MLFASDLHGIAALIDGLDDVDRRAERSGGRPSGVRTKEDTYASIAIGAELPIVVGNADTEAVQVGSVVKDDEGSWYFEPTSELIVEDYIRPILPNHPWVSPDALRLYGGSIMLCASS